MAPRKNNIPNNPEPPSIEIENQPARKARAKASEKKTARQAVRTTKRAGAKPLSGEATKKKPARAKRAAAKKGALVSKRATARKSAAKKGAKRPSVASRKVSGRAKAGKSVRAKKS